MNGSIFTPLTGTLVNIFLGCFCVTAIAATVSILQGISGEHRREKRMDERNARDLEYHDACMKELHRK